MAARGVTRTSRNGGATSGLGAAALVALACGTTLGNVGGNVMPSLLAGFGERFALSDTSAGFVAAAQLLATAIVTLALSARASRPGRAGLARWGLGAAAIGFAVAWLSPTVAVLVGANIVAGAGLGAVFAAGTAALSSTPDVDRATFRTVLAATLATAALIMLVSLANGIGGGTAGFAVLAACCAAGLWGVAGMPERPAAQTASVGPRPPVLFLLAVLAFGIIEQGTWSYAAVFGMRHAGLSEGTASLALSVAALAALVGVPLGTFTAQRYGRVAGILAIGGLGFIAKALVIIAPTGAVFAVAASVWQICYLGLLVQILALAAGTDRSGRLVAATAGAVALGTGIGPAVIGTTLDIFGPAGVVGAVTLLGAAALVPQARLAARIPRPGSVTGEERNGAAATVGAPADGAVTTARERPAPETV